MSDTIPPKVKVALPGLIGTLIPDDGSDDPSIVQERRVKASGWAKDLFIRYAYFSTSGMTIEKTAEQGSLKRRRMRSV